LQVVDFKQVTTNHILQNTSVSSKHIPFRHIFTVGQPSRGAYTHRRGVSGRPHFGLSAKRLKTAVNDKTVFYTHKHTLKEHL
jgi:hypothetical protein